MSSTCKFEDQKTRIMFYNQKFWKIEQFLNCNFVNFDRKTFFKKGKERLKFLLHEKFIAKQNWASGAVFNRTKMMIFVNLLFKYEPEILVCIYFD